MPTLRVNPTYLLSKFEEVRIRVGFETAVPERAGMLNFPYLALAGLSRARDGVRTGSPLPLPRSIGKQERKAEEE